MTNQNIDLPLTDAAVFRRAAIYLEELGATFPQEVASPLASQFLGPVHPLPAQVEAEIKQAIDQIVRRKGEVSAQLQQPVQEQSGSATPATFRSAIPQQRTLVVRSAVSRVTGQTLPFSGKSSGTAPGNGQAVSSFPDSEGPVIGTQR